MSAPGFAVQGRRGERSRAALSLCAALALAIACSPEDTGPLRAPGRPIAINELVWSIDGGPGDWVELVNRSDEVISLSGWQLRDAQDGASHRFSFSEGTSLAPGALLLVYQEGAGPAGDAPRYPFGLARSDSLRLFDPDGVFVDGTSWIATDFEGGESWGRCGDDPETFGPLTSPTPGGGNTPCRSVRTVSLVLNEVGLTGADEPGFVEVGNRGEETADLAGWQLDLREGDSGWFVFPAESRLAPGEYAVVSAAWFSPSDRPPEIGPPVLAGDGRVSLFAPDGQLVDDTDWEREAGLAAGDAWGRCPEWPGAWARMEAPTPGTANAACAPFVPPPVVLNEVLGFGTADGAIEVLNRGDSAVSLDGWTVTNERKGGPDAWETPAGTSLGPGEYLVVPAPNLPLGGEVELSDAQGRWVDATRVPDGTVGLDDAWGRCPADPSEFGRTPSPTPGEPNAPCDAWRLLIRCHPNRRR